MIFLCLNYLSFYLFTYNNCRVQKSCLQLPVSQSRVLVKNCLSLFFRHIFIAFVATCMVVRFYFLSLCTLHYLSLYSCYKFRSLNDFFLSHVSIRRTFFLSGCFLLEWTPSYSTFYSGTSSSAPSKKKLKIKTKMYIEEFFNRSMKM